MKPRIFIGSSSEGLDVAKYIKSSLNGEFDCFLWTDDIFKYNESFLDTLLKEASLFDFGILIATQDDYSRVRDKSFVTPRDNIVFEFGLFIGRIGSSRAFVLQESDVKLPSDMSGITVPQFKKTPDLKDSESLNSEIEKIKKTIREKISLGELGLLPSTVLAIGYFYNFVQIVADCLYNTTDLVVDETKFSSFEINIVLPKDLDADIKKRANVYSKSKSLRQIPLDCAGRNYPIYVSYNEASSTKLKLYDMPTTLGGIDKAIEMYMKKGHIGKSSQQQLLEERELRNFESTLQNLINNDAYCKHLVKIIIED